MAKSKFPNRILIRLTDEALAALGRLQAQFVEKFGEDYSINKTVNRVIINEDKRLDKVKAKRGE